MSGGGGLNVNANEYRPPGAPAPNTSDSSQGAEAPATTKGVNAAAKPFVPGFLAGGVKPTTIPPANAAPHLRNNQPPQQSGHHGGGGYQQAVVQYHPSTQAPQSSQHHQRDLQYSNHQGQQQQQQQGGQYNNPAPQQAQSQLGQGYQQHPTQSSYGNQQHPTQSSYGYQQHPTQSQDGGNQQHQGGQQQGAQQQPGSNSNGQQHQQQGQGHYQGQQGGVPGGYPPQGHGSQQYANNSSTTTSYQQQQGQHNQQQGQQTHHQTHHQPQYGGNQQHPQHQGVAAGHHQGNQQPQQQQMPQPRSMQPPAQQQQSKPQPRTMAPVPAAAGQPTRGLPPKPVSTGAPAPTSSINDTPFVVLLLGVRGSGKSTQSTKIAHKFGLMHLSSGDLARQGRDPLADLDTALNGWLSTEGKIKSDTESSHYKGLILDRFVALSPYDVYYLGHILQKYNLRINLVVHLNVDPEVGSDRARQRDEGGEQEQVHSSPVRALASAPTTTRPQRDGRRLVEQSLLAETNRTLFEGSGALRQVHVMSRSIDEVATEVQELVSKGLGEMPRKFVTLPRASMDDGSPLVTDHLLFKEVKHGLHTVMGTPPTKFDQFPGSQMTGQMTQAEWKKAERFLNNYFVTLKADGKRVLLVRWGHRVFIMPGKFVCMYELLAKNIPSALMATKRDEARDGPMPTEGPASKLHFIFDSEFVQQNKTDRWCYYLFDYVYYEGKKAVKVAFNDRYKALTTMMGESAAYSSVFVKEFVTLPNIAKILPGSFKDENLPFEIDGLVFQHDGPYKVPQDNRVFKWKPREMCSVDFRLCNAAVLPPQAHDTDCITRFQLATIANVDGVKDERPYLGGRAVLLASEDLVRKHNLANGTVIEALKARWSLESYHSGTKGNKNKFSAPAKKEDTAAVEDAPQEWTMMRVRTDKAFPNAEEIAVAIDGMKPWSLDELRKECLRVPPPRR